MIWGILAVTAYLFAAAKYITHRMKNKKYDRIFLKIHVAAGALLPLAAAVHTVKMFKTKPSLGQAVSGLCADAGIIGLMVSHFFAKKLGKKALPMHRFSTVFTGTGIVAHLIKCVK